MLKKRLGKPTLQIKGLTKKKRVKFNSIILLFIFLILISSINARAVDITNCTVITSPGEYLLQNDITNSVNSTCIDIQTDNVMVNCQGHVIDGVEASSSFGINLDSLSNITIRNCIVNGWEKGIYLSSATDSNITNNTVKNNTYGLFLVYSSKNILSNNIVGNNSFGIFLFSATNNKITNNSVYYNEYGLSLKYSPLNNLTNNDIQENGEEDIYFSDVSSDNDCNNVIKNNTGSGNKPIEFFNSSVSLQNKVLSELILCNADNSYINNVSIKGSTTLQNNGLFVFRTEDSNITNVNSSGNYEGISLFDSSYNDILTNKVYDNNDTGVYLSNSSFNTLTNNTANNSVYGIFLSDSSNNVLKNNIADYNTYGIKLGSSSKKNTLINNTASYNNQEGFFLHSGLNNTLTRNIANGNGYDGFGLYFSMENTITNNTISNNANNGIYLYNSSSNSIINNKANYNYYGMYLDSSSNNILTNNLANHNYYGMYLFYSSNNTMTNNTISNNYRYGIELYSSSKNIVIINKVNYNDYGFYLESSSNNNITNNTASNNNLGISLKYSSNNIITFNDIKENREEDISFFDVSSNEYCNNIIKNNTGSGNKPIKFFNSTRNLENEFLSELILCNADHSSINNVTIEGSATLKNNGLLVFRTDNSQIMNINSSENNDGISLSDSLNNNITNCTFNNNSNGIYLKSSSNNIITNNIIDYNNDKGIYVYASSLNNFTSNAVSENKDGIWLDSSSNNTLMNNIVNNSNDYGIYLHNSSLNTFTNNAVSENNDGIWLDSSLNNTLTNNTANKNHYNGIYGYSSSLNTLTNNVLSNNYDGILLDSSSNNVLTNNAIMNNSDYGIYIHNAGENEVYNNFFNNSNNFYSFGSINSWNTTLQEGERIHGKGTLIGGNYWAKPNGLGYSESCDDNDWDGICDLGYSLSTNNTDYLPLSKGYQNTSLPILLTKCTNITLSGEYFFQDNLSDSDTSVCINLLTDNVVIDCQNHIIDGNRTSEGYGIYLNSSSNITIKNCIVKNWGVGIFLDSAHLNNLTNNTMNNNTFGLYLTNSSNNIITNNIASNNTNGVFLHSSSNNIITNNDVKENEYVDILFWLVSLDSSCNNIVENNTGSGDKPIKFFNSSVNLQNEVLSELILCNADDSNINNVTIGGSATLQNNGVFILRTNNSNITNINSSGNYGGIFLSDSSNNNNITNCTFNDNSNGIYLESSSNNIFTKNNASNNTNDGSYLYNSSNNNITNCTFNDNSYGIYLDSISLNTLANNVMNNNDYGIYLDSSSNNILTKNKESNNTNDGSYLYNSSNNSIIKNTATYNSAGIDFISSSNNIIANNTVKYNDNYGTLFSYSSSNNTVINNTLNYNYYGIYLYSSSNNVLTKNKASNNTDGGIYLYNSSSSSIINNTASYNYYGIDLDSSSNNILTKNLANNNYYGIYLSNSLNITLNMSIVRENVKMDIYLNPSKINCNNIIENNTGSGNKPIKFFNSNVSLQNEVLSELILCNADDSNINNVTIEGSTTVQNNGIFVFKTNNSNITNIKSSGNYYGTYLHDSSNNTLTTSKIFNNINGIYLEFNSNKNKVTNNTVDYNNYGIYLSNSSNNTIINNKAGNNNDYGIYVYHSNENMFYNNLFNNTNNFYFSGNITNSWNTTLQEGKRVYGLGTLIGGNYWAKPNGLGYSETCVDSNLNDICDLEYDLTTNNTDYVPLGKRDLIPPIISIINPDNITYTNQTILVDISSDGDNVWFNWDGTNTTYTNPTEISFNEGSNTLIAYANDSSGNINSTSVSFTVDTIPPSIAMTSPNNITYTNATILVNISSDGDNVWFNWDGANVTYTSPIQVTFNEGSNTLIAYANDSSGNINSTSVSFTVDTIPPLITIVNPKNETYTNQTILVNISSEGDNVWFDWNGTNVTYTNPIEINFNEGSNTLIAYANDSAGNINSTSVLFTVDTIPPPIAIISPNNITYTNATILVNISSDGDNVWFNWDGTNVTYTNPTEVTFNEGSNTLIAYANDSVGNINSTSVPFTVDTIPPLITIVNPENKTYKNATILVNISSEGDNVWFNWDGTNVTYTKPTEVTFNEGSNTLIAYANDSVGNINSTSVSFIVNTTIKKVYSINLTKPDNKVISKGTNATYVIKVTNNGTVSDNYTILLNNLNNASIAQLNQTTITNLGAGRSANVTLIVGDGRVKNYTINVTVTSNSNASVYNQISIMTQVVSKPIILKSTIKPHAVINGSNLKLSINVLNAQTIWARILKPDLSYQNITLTNNANTTFNNTMLIGKYNVTFYANNSLGEVTSLNDSFEVYPPISFNVRIINHNQIGINSSLTVYYKNETLIINNSENGNFTKDLVNAILNLKFKSYSNRFQVELRKVNISRNNGKTFGMDKLTEPVSGYLVTYGIKNNYSFRNATLRVYYDDLHFSKEGNLRLYKCDNWNLSTQSCTGKWAEITENLTQNIANNYFSYLTTSFSGFSIKEELQETHKSSGSSSSGIISNQQCVKNSDCLISQYCYENKCHNYECSSDKDCNANQFCYEHNCTDYECSSEKKCNNLETCYAHRCVKLFSIKKLNVKPLLKPGELFNFSCLIKSKVNITGNVNVSFWLEKDNKTVISGSNSIYLNNSNEIQRSLNLSIPLNVSIGIYDIYVLANFEGNKTKTNQKVEIRKTVPLILDIKLDKIPSRNNFNFSSVLSFNKDTSTKVLLKEEIKKGNKSVWKKEQNLQINRKKVISENVGRLKQGEYELELIGHYDENKTVKVSQKFNVKAKEKYLEWYAILALIVDGIVTILFVFWLRK